MNFLSDNIKKTEERFQYKAINCIGQTSFIFVLCFFMPLYLCVSLVCKYILVCQNTMTSKIFVRI